MPRKTVAGLGRYSFEELRTVARLSRSARGGSRWFPPLASSKSINPWHNFAQAKAQEDDKGSREDGR